MKRQDLYSRLNVMEQTLQSNEFLDRIGKDREADYWIFDYSPEDELKIRERISFLKNSAVWRVKDCNLVEFDLYDMMVEFLERKNYIEKCIVMEERNGLAGVVKAINSAMRMIDSKNYIVQEIEKKISDRSIIFITGVGKCYPILRAHQVLNTLHQTFTKAPVVLFYPGKFTESGLSLFDTMSDGGYYRAKIFC